MRITDDDVRHLSDGAVQLLAAPAKPIRLIGLWEGGRGKVPDPETLRRTSQQQMPAGHLSHLHFDTGAVIVWLRHRRAQAARLKEAKRP